MPVSYPIPSLSLNVECAKIWHAFTPRRTWCALVRWCCLLAWIAKFEEGEWESAETRNLKRRAPVETQNPMHSYPALCPSSDHMKDGCSFLTLAWLTPHSFLHIPWVEDYTCWHLHHCGFTWSFDPAFIPMETWGPERLFCVACKYIMIVAAQLEMTYL